MVRQILTGFSQFQLYYESDVNSSPHVFAQWEESKCKMCVIVTFHNIYPSHVIDRVSADKKFKEII